MLPRTHHTLVFAGLSAVGLSLVVTPATARIVEQGRRLYANQAQKPPDQPSGPWADISRVLEIDREIAIKNDLAADLIAGRRTLDEVTDDFLLLIQNREVEFAAIRSRYEGESDREKVAQTVLKFASCQEGVSDGDLARLDAEFRSLFPHATAPNAHNAAAPTNQKRSDAKLAPSSEPIC